MVLLQAGWSHQDGDTYVTEDVARSECSITSPGESHGICDGFGTCQCAPPFIGDDCSIKARGCWQLLGIHGCFPVPCYVELAPSHVGTYGFPGGHAKAKIIVEKRRSFEKPALFLIFKHYWSNTISRTTGLEVNLR